VTGSGAPAILAPTPTAGAAREDRLERVLGQIEVVRSGYIQEGKDLMEISFDPTNRSERNRIRRLLRALREPALAASDGEIWAWARRAGWQGAVGSRGRVSPEVRAAYEKAHSPGESK
jgi:hypothetical protein